MQSQGKFDQVALLDIAQKQGIDSTRLKLEMDKPEITAELDNNRRLGEELGIHGTPALIINDQIVPGAMSYDELKKLISATNAPVKHAGQQAEDLMLNQPFLPTHNAHDRCVAGIYLAARVAC